MDKELPGQKGNKDIGQTIGRRLGIFVAGYRWSGSSAVKDWLLRYAGIDIPPGSDISDGEIKALNYGLQNLLLIAEGKSLLGEHLARCALCPDKSLWPEVLGPPLLHESGLAARSASLCDRALMLGAARFLRPGLEHYPALLREHLGKDHTMDKEYLEAVSRLVKALRQESPPVTPAGPGRVQLSKAVSKFAALFYDRQLQLTGTVPVFDNAIAGANCRYFSLLHEGIFPKQAIFLVRRDPRDQFAEQVRFSARTCSWMIRRFVRQYLDNHSCTMRFIKAQKDNPGKIVRLIPFESFVLDPGFRADLSSDLEKMMASCYFSTARQENCFDSEQSRRNIGVWKKSGLKRQVEFISRELRPFLRPEAD